MNTTHPTIQPSELKNLLDNDCCLIDVREPVEHAEEHIEGATLIPLGQIEDRTSEIDTSVPIVVMCGTGKRGMEALKKLESQGMMNVRNLEGGIQEWKAKGQPVNKSENKSLPLMQQVQIAIGVGVLLGVILSRTVHPQFIYLSAFFGAGILFAGISGWCGLAMLLAKMPWNRVAGQSCCSGKGCSSSN